jgi:hypothetical protein
LNRREQREQRKNCSREGAKTRRVLLNAETYRCLATENAKTTKGHADLNRREQTKSCSRKDAKTRREPTQPHPPKAEPMLVAGGDWGESRAVPARSTKVRYCVSKP